MRNLRILLCAAVAMILVGCGNVPKEPAARTPPKPVPDVFRVKFDTSKGPFTVEVHKAWAPEGAERFYRLVEQRYYDDARFFRVVRNFVVQFGINGNPRLSELWRNMTIKDDPVKEKNRRGYLSYAKSGPNSRTTQVFINLKDNAILDKTGFAPFGRVVDGMEEVVDRLYLSYGDIPPKGNGPDPTQIELRGNRYLEDKFPRLDYIRTARIE